MLMNGHGHYDTHAQTPVTYYILYIILYCCLHYIIAVVVIISHFFSSLYVEIYYFPTKSLLLYHDVQRKILIHTSQVPTL